MAGNYWIKFYCEILDDPKMATLPDRLWRRFYELCLLAGKQNKDGEIPPANQIAWALRMDATDVQRDIDELITIGLVTVTDSGYVVTNFSKRQEKATNTERVARYREAKHKDEYYGNENVTQMKRNVTQITDNRYREQITDTEQIQSETGAPSPVQQMIESVIGIPPANPSDLKALDEIEALNPTLPDIQAAYTWLSEQGKRVKYYSSLVGPIRTSISKRVQKPMTTLEKSKAAILQAMAEMEAEGVDNDIFK